MSCVGLTLQGLNVAFKCFEQLTEQTLQGKLERKVTGTVFGEQSFAGFIVVCGFVGWVLLFFFKKLEKSFEIVYCNTVCRSLNYVLYTWLTIYGAMSYLIG